MLDVLFFGVLPYVAIALFFGVSIVRYRRDPAAFSARSTQFLDSGGLFWGSVPFHLGLLILVAGHLVGFLLPSAVTAWNRVPLRLFVLEATAMTAAVLVLFGLVALAYRRVACPRVRAVTSASDLLVHALLLAQVVTGLWVAVGTRWGSAWYTHTAAPYLWSVVSLSPDVERMAELKLAAKLHVGSAWLFFAIFPFTRLVHAFVAPVAYVWRPAQLVIWHRDRNERRVPASRGA